MMIDGARSYVVEGVNDERLKLVYAPLGPSVAGLLLAALSLHVAGPLSVLCATAGIAGAVLLIGTWGSVTIRFDDRVVETRCLVNRTYRARYAWARARKVEGPPFSGGGDPVVELEVQGEGPVKLRVFVRVPPRHADLKRFIRRFNELAGADDEQPVSEPCAEQERSA